MSLVSPQTLATTAVPTLPLQLPKLDNTYGAALLGTLFALILDGVAINQAFNYFSVHTSDAWRMKVYVCSLIAMDTLYTVASIDWLYIRLINDFFQPTKLLLVDIWSVKSLPVITGATVALCQVFLAYRIWRIDPRYRFFVIIIIFLVIAELGFASGATYKAAVANEFSEFESSTWVVTTAFGFGVTIDVLLTTVMMIFLRGKRSGFDRTNSLLDKLTAYTMATGLMTTICATLTIAFSITYPNAMIYIGVDSVVTILYTNGILAAINLRRPQQESTSLVNTSVNAARIHVDAFQGSTTSRISTHAGLSASRVALDNKATEGHGREPVTEFELRSLA